MNVWDDLRYVLALEKCGNLVKAANVLKTNPTTISRRIKRISDYYQRTIFIRHASGEWRLTPEGQEIAAAARKCDEEIGRLAPSFKESKDVKIKISTVNFLADRMLTPNLYRLREPDHAFSITIDTTARNVSLAYGEADLAIRLGRPQSGKLIASKLCDLNMGIFSQREEVSDQDWVGAPSEYDWLPEMQLGYRFFNKPPAIRVGNYDSMARIARELDLACVGPHVAMQYHAGLRSVLDDSAYCTREVWCIHHESRHSDSHLLRVRAWVKGCFAKDEAQMAA